jgi:nuclear pore complex protein Nup62
MFEISYCKFFKIILKVTYVCTYVRMYVCMYKYVCMYVRMYVCMYKYVYMYVRMYVSLYVYMYVCVYVCTYIMLRYVCMYGCMYVFMCVCLYVCTYVCIITDQISSREHELHTQGILRVVVTGNIDRLPTGSQEGYLWLGLSSFINTVTSVLILYYSQSIYLCPALLQIVSTNTPLYCLHTSPQSAHTSVS